MKLPSTMNWAWHRKRDARSLIVFSRLSSPVLQTWAARPRVARYRTKHLCNDSAQTVDLFEREV